VALGSKLPSTFGCKPELICLLSKAGAGGSKTLKMGGPGYWAGDKVRLLRAWATSVLIVRAGYDPLGSDGLSRALFL